MRRWTLVAAHGTGTCVESWKRYLSLFSLSMCLRLMVGAGENGQLGLGDNAGARALPKLVMFLTDQAITCVAAGGNQSACLDELGRMYEWGQVAEGRAIVSKPALKVYCLFVEVFFFFFERRGFTG